VPDAAASKRVSHPETTHSQRTTIRHYQGAKRLEQTRGTKRLEQTRGTKRLEQTRGTKRLEQTRGRFRALIPWRTYPPQAVNGCACFKQSRNQ
jgi:hypothetical protein